MSSDSQPSPDRPDPNDGNPALRARVPDGVADGCFSTGAIVMTGPSEFIVSDDNGENFLLDSRPVLTGENLVDAQLGFNPDTGLPVVNFRFDSAGARIFGQYTAANQGQLFAIVLDDVVITAPRIRSPILGGAGR